MIVFLGGASSFARENRLSSDSLLQAVVTAIQQKDVYVKQRLHRIEALRHSLSATPRSNLIQRFNVSNALYYEYRKFIYDSAFAYAKRLVEIANTLQDKKRLAYARVKLGYTLVSSGFFKEAFDSLRRVELESLPDTSMMEYYTLMSRAYFDLAAYDNDHYYKSTYQALGIQYNDSALSISLPGSYDSMYLSGVHNIKMGNYQQALVTAHAVLNLPLTHQQRAVNSFDLSVAYKMLGDTGKAVEHLAHAALADICGAIKETAAMYTLAGLLFQQGDLERAHIFILQAQDDALYYGARQRQVEVAMVLPMIAAAKLHNVDGQRKKWLWYSGALTIMVLLIVAFAYIIYKQLKKLKAAELTIKSANQKLQESNRKLREANRIKEEYIGYYFNINSEYLTKIENFKKAIDAKLVAKKMDDLRFIVDNINLKREREELSFSFDKVFITLFPDFVSTFNSFFNQEDRIVLKEGQLLNTELRIFALIRMGINDTEKIAKILGYSVNTIYAYKTRMKTKSILPNESFEQRIMDIKTT